MQRPQLCLSFSFALRKYCNLHSFDITLWKERERSEKYIFQRNPQSRLKWLSHLFSKMICLFAFTPVRHLSFQLSLELHKKRRSNEKNHARVNFAKQFVEKPNDEKNIQIIRNCSLSYLYEHIYIWLYVFQRSWPMSLKDCHLTQIFFVSFFLELTLKVWVIVRKDTIIEGQNRSNWFRTSFSWLLSDVGVLQ